MLPELSSAPVISISGLVSGGSSSGAVRPPEWVRGVALLPHLLFRALAAAVTVWSYRRPLVVFLVSPVSFLGTVRILNYGRVLFSFPSSLLLSYVFFSDSATHLA